METGGEGKFCRQNFDIYREEGAGVLPSLYHSLVRIRLLSRRVRAHWFGERERESNLEKAAEEICPSGRPLFFFRCTARR